jgi:CheY-like chemotaxis protein/anti-sigma regulatory factor (Ser/Thr protein kinase)
MDRQLTALVVDDDSQTRLMVSRFVTKLGHIAITAQNGLDAVAAFVAYAPDLVLMDVQMPEMNGYEAARRIRQLGGPTWTPIIFLSAGTEEDDHVRGLEAGGDDYLTKPVRFRMLEAKIKALQRIAHLQRQLQEHTEQLAQYRDENEREQCLAKYLMDRIVRTAGLEEAWVQRWMMPAQHFSGDLLATAYAPSGVLHVILADGTGHGLSAALNVMPVVEVFYGMTERGFAISSIARELNRKLRQLMPTGRFVAATLACVAPEQQTIEIWNGGNPATLFIAHDGRLVGVWPSVHPALGILSSEDFDERIEVYQWQEPGQLYLYSDGLVEAEDKDGNAFGEEQLEHVLANASYDNRLVCLRAAVSAHLGGRPAHDDVSLIVLDCPAAGDSGCGTASKRAEQESWSVCSVYKWKLGLRLSANELKTIDILPFLMEWVDQARINNEHRGQIFLILAELLNNALDHGLLALDSNLKAAPDGFERYLAMRVERLAALTFGLVEVEIEPCQTPEGEFLQLRVKDSGNGFDHATLLQEDITQSTTYAGRGIALVRDLCSKVEYLGNGNEVIALYQLSEGL